MVSENLTSSSNGGASIKKLQAAVAEDATQNAGEDSGSRVVVDIGVGADLVAAADAEVLAADVLGLSVGERVEGSLDRSSGARSGGDGEGHGNGGDGGGGELHFEKIEVDLKVEVWKWQMMLIKMDEDY